MTEQYPLTWNDLIEQAKQKAMKYLVSNTGLDDVANAFEIFADALKNYDSKHQPNTTWGGHATAAIQAAATPDPEPAVRLGDVEIAASSIKKKYLQYVVRHPDGKIWVWYHSFNSWGLTEQKHIQSQAELWPDSVKFMTHAEAFRIDAIARFEIGDFIYQAPISKVKDGVIFFQRIDWKGGEEQIRCITDSHLYLIKPAPEKTS